MKTNLDKYDIKNIEDCIPWLEKMYKFKFEKGETESVKNFDQLCDLIITKIDFQNVESCSSQQAFYKLRNSLVQEQISEKDNIKLETKLNDLFPRNKRIKLVKKVENNIGFKLNILQAPKLILNSIIAVLIISFILLFIKWQFGISGILISSLGIYLCNLFGKEIEIETVKELVE
ncbi:hypothetical protein [Flavobacterium sp. DSP2-3-1]|uniref:hypothetical protein n=1 Tax=Flavobacterium sp. DSP2-3-1 TaxID=2804620 RepID=UPI003CF603D9